MAIATSTHCYVGTLACGCGVAIVVDDPEYRRDTAKSVAEMIEHGYVVGRWERDAGVEAFCHHCANYPHEPWQKRNEDARQQRALVLNERTESVQAAAAEDWKGGEIPNVTQRDKESV